MVRLTKIYTRKGDDGKTALGTGQRVTKDHAQVEAYGEVDELNAALGLARAAGLDAELDASLHRIQSELLNLGGLLCMLDGDKGPGDFGALVEARHVEALEKECDRYNADLGTLENFILPGGSEGAARLHVARVVARRAERRVVALAHHIEVPGNAVAYINRLSDLLFIMARYENKARGQDDVLWDKSV